MIIWIDADACPRGIKDIITKAALRLKIKVILVANTPVGIPEHSLIEFVRVPNGMDVADQYIVEHCHTDDIVITADIPLADRIVTKGAIGINPRGEVYSTESIREKLSVRNFMTDMRNAGIISGGPKPFTNTDKRKFAATFDKIIMQKIIRKSSHK